MYVYIIIIQSLYVSIIRGAVCNTQRYPYVYIQYTYRRPINHLQCGQHIYVQCTYGVCTSICQRVRASQFEGIVSDHIAQPGKAIYNIHNIKPRTTCAKRIKKLLINIPEASQVIYFRGVQKNDFIKTFNLFTFIYSFCIPFPSIRTYYYT